MSKLPFSVRLDLDKLSELVSTYDKNVTILNHIPQISFVFGKFNKSQLGVFSYSETKDYKINYIEIDVGNIISSLKKRDQKTGRLAQALKNKLTKTIAHEIGHWYMYNTNPELLVDPRGNWKFRTLYMMATIFLGVMMLFSGAVIADSFWYASKNAVIWITVVIGGILFGFGINQIHAMADSVAGTIVYDLSKAEKFARKFEKWAETDKRWDEVVDVQMRTQAS